MAGGPGRSRRRHDRRCLRPQRALRKDRCHHPQDQTHLPGSERPAIDQHGVVDRSHCGVHTAQPPRAHPAHHPRRPRRHLRGDRPPHLALHPDHGTQTSADPTGGFALHFVTCDEIAKVIAPQAINWERDVLKWDE